MEQDGAFDENFEISPRFRSIIEERIARLERDVADDEAGLEQLSHSDHIRRHMRLVAAQRAESVRMRQFLNRSGIRLPRPQTSL